MLIEIVLMTNGILISLIFWELKSHKKKERDLSIANWEEITPENKRQIMIYLQNKDCVII